MNFLSSIVNIHFFIIMYVVFIFDKRDCVMTLRNVFEILSKRIMIKQKTNNIDNIFIIDDISMYNILILHFNLQNEKCFVEIIVCNFLWNTMYFISSLLCIFKISIIFINNIFTIFVNDFFWCFDSIKSSSQKIFFFVFEKSKLLIKILNFERILIFEDRFSIARKWIFSKYVFHKFARFLSLNLLKRFDIDRESCDNRSSYSSRFWEDIKDDCNEKWREINDQSDMFLQRIFDNFSKLNCCRIDVVSRVINCIQLIFVNFFLKINNEYFIISSIASSFWKFSSLISSKSKFWIIDVDRSIFRKFIFHQSSSISSRSFLFLFWTWFNDCFLSCEWIVFLRRNLQRSMCFVIKLFLLFWYKHFQKKHRRRFCMMLIRMRKMYNHAHIIAISTMNLMLRLTITIVLIITQ